MLIFRNADRLTKLKSQNKLTPILDSFAFSYHLDDNKNLALNFTLLAYENQNNQVKYWGDEIENGMIYENCNFNVNNESNIILAIFKMDETIPNGRFLYQTRLNLIRKEFNGSNFFDLNAQINSDVLNNIVELKNIEDENIILRIYKDSYSENDIYNNLLATYSKKFQISHNENNISPDCDNKTPMTRARRSYLQNSNELSLSANETDYDSLTFTYRPNKNGNLVCDFNVLTYKSNYDNNDQKIKNNLIYDNYISNRENENSVVLSIFEQRDNTEDKDKLIYQTKLKLIKKGVYNKNEFLILNAEIGPEIIANLKGKDLSLKLYKNQYDPNSPENGLLAIYCGGVYDRCFYI